VRKKFFIFTGISLPKNGGGGKTRETILPETLLVRAKNVRKKIIGKKCKNFFYIHTNIVNKKWGEKIAK